MLVQRLEREKISFFFPTCSTLELCGSFWTPQVPHFWFCTRKLAFFWFRDSLQLSPIIFRLGDIKIPPKDWKRGPPEPAWPVLMRVNPPRHSEHEKKNFGGPLEFFENGTRSALVSVSRYSETSTRYSFPRLVSIWLVSMLVFLGLRS